MKTLASECIILKRTEYKERDRLVTLLLKDQGHCTGIARGAQKITSRGVGTYEPLSFGVIHYTPSRNSGLLNLRKMDASPPYLLIEGGYETFLIGSYLAELADICAIKGGEPEPYFMLLKESLETLLQVPPTLYPLKRLEFELNLLAILGLSPAWGHCTQCEKPLVARKENSFRPLSSAPHQFNAKGHGMRCPDCRMGGAHLHDISAGALTFLLNYQQDKAHIKPTGQALKQLQGAITDYLTQHLEKTPRSLELLPPL